MKVLTVLLLTAFAVFAIDADDMRKAGFNKLSESQKAEFIQQIEQTAITSGKSTIFTGVFAFIIMWVTV